MLTVKAAASIAGVCPGLVYIWVGSGKLAHYRLGRPGSRGAIRIAEEDLKTFLATLKREEAPKEAPPTPKVAREKPTFRHLNIR